MHVTRMLLLPAAVILMTSCDSVQKNLGIGGPPAAVEKSAPQPEKKTAERPKDGLQTNYRKDGSLLSEINYKDGQMDGLSKSYYKSGKLQVEYPYTAGKLHGEVKWYHENGQVYKLFPYLEGKKEGLHRVFSAEGKLMAEVPYKNGFAGAAWKEYSASGKVVAKPTLIIETIDEVLRKNTFSLRVRVSEKAGEVKYYVGELTSGQFMHDDLMRMAPRNGVLELDYTVAPGHFRMEKIYIVAELPSRHGYSKVIHTVYNLAIENR